MNRPNVVADLPLMTDVQELLEKLVNIVPLESVTTGVHPEIAGLYTMSHPVIAGEFMDRLPNLRVISNYGVGVDHIDLIAAAQRGIPVGHTPGVLDGATADLAFGLLIASARNITRGDSLAHQPHRWSERRNLLGQEVFGSTVGIVGLGRIGRQIARRAVGFDMKILYHNRNRDMEAERELPVTYSTLDQLLQSVDFLILSVPLTSQTKNLLGHREISLMRSNAIVINIARGAVIDTDALTKAIINKQIAGAALDVTEPEPLPAGHPLLQLDNVIITPHLGSASARTRSEMAVLSVKNLMAGLDNKPLFYQAMPSPNH